ncbi:MAG: SDR family NAD(P)-dependent oxidoreductase [Emcibacteraceae bacterium]|nr:SDR family NAD(P)-dependent oxidoreductase [Emcibacteraceae bacterium]
MTKTVLVTGGNRGIGLEIVQELAKLNFKVLLGCRDVVAGIEIVKNLAGNIHVVKIDLSNSAVLRKQAQDILNAFGTIDVLVNNGAILKDGTTLSIEPNDFYQSMQVNLNAPFDLIQMLLPPMIKQNYGRIVNVTSDWGSFADGLMGPAAYSVSKAALNALTMNTAQDLPSGVKINAVHPGWVKTDMGGPSATLSTAEGAETIIWLATLDGNGPSGGFFHNKQSKEW